MATKANVTVNFTPEKITKNTVRFAEIVDGEFSAPSIGTLYVPKTTLSKIGYSEGKTLIVTINAE